MSFEGLSGIRELIPVGANVAVASHGTDKGLVAEFYYEAVEQFFEGTNPDGSPRPVVRKTFKDVPFVHIFAPGNKSDIRRPVVMETTGQVPSDPERFPRQWAAFKNSQEQAQSGFPLEQWARLSKAEVMEWKAAKVHTVEQLAEIPDSASQNFPLNFRKMRDAAKNFLAASDGDAGTMARLESENDTLKADIKMLKDQIAALGAGENRRK